MLKEREETFANLVNSTAATMPPILTKPKSEHSHRTYASRPSIKRSKPIIYTPTEKITKLNSTVLRPKLNLKIDISGVPVINTVDSLKPAPKPKNSSMSTSQAIIESIKSSRLNLRQALAKAKDKKSKESMNPDETLLEKESEVVDTRIENYIIEEDIPNADDEVSNLYNLILIIEP